MSSTSIDGKLSALEQLIDCLATGEPAPLAHWRGRLEAILASDGLQPAQRAQLHGILARIVSLEAGRGALLTH
ncbi:hypothetical protein [Burkholderia glumae]|uniref:Uncharacterized protein n=1 Tax=Burkholderia glumae TaxID=337 RepID=A0AAP9XXS4_BURGL|nr:hypothetical protein [Burkholderia glumae]AJY64606.1 hypothetical protein KS03_5412 [Burkholderia glumae LMG 2196 = ATCC 33617]KHJ59366.1 hypothetical protein NCPPB3923_29780 [Burkholderia glumae]MCM2483740.1 hypothetical protein [Burkholderia glumae]MCM2494085.1 hypothetical protein [Burkholderia glumae]MCM2509434.1 hypothetical protein [Burkholderia glumae]